MVLTKASNDFSDGANSQPKAHNSESLSILSNAALNEMSENGKVAGLKRATTVMAGGLADGMVNGLANAAEHKWETTKHIAESFGVGYGLSAVSKIEKFGKPGATAAGLAMGAYWVYSELNAGRPQAAWNALDDAYHSGKHLDANRKQFAATGGAMAFDTALAITAGGAGFYTAGKMHPLHIEAASGIRTGYNKALDVLSRDPEGLGRSFAGKDSTGPFEQMRDLVSGKQKGTSSLADLQAHMERQRLSGDQQIIDIQERMKTAGESHSDLALREANNGTSHSRLTQEREAINSLSAEKEAVTKAQRDLETTRELARSIPEKEAEVGQLSKAAEDAKRRVRNELDEEGQPTAEKLASDEKAAAHAKAARELIELKEMASPDAIRRAGDKVQSAEAALKEAQASQPQRLAEKDAQLEASRQEQALLAAERAGLTADANTLLTAHRERMSALLKDPSLFVQGTRPEPLTVVRERVTPIKKGTEAGDSGSAMAADALASVGEKPAAVEVVKPEPQTAPEKLVDKVEKVEKPVYQPSPEFEAARTRTTATLRSNELGRELATHRETLRQIESGEYKPGAGRTLDDVRATANHNIENVNGRLGGESPASYTRAIKSVAEFARTTSRELAKIADADQRGQFASMAIDSLEAMMNRLPNAYKGFKNDLPDISPVRGGSSPELRLNEIQTHLEAKAKLLDGSRNKQLQEQTEAHPILSDVLRRAESGELPEDGTIVLFGKDGSFLHPATSRSPHFIEVRRLMEHGVGADGGGFNRFIAEGDNIAGGAVLRPVYKDGVPVEVPSRSATGKPVFKKEIVGLFGQVSDAISVGDNFVRILEKLKPSDRRPS